MLITKRSTPDGRIQRPHSQSPLSLRCILSIRIKNPIVKNDTYENERNQA